MSVRPLIYVAGPYTSPDPITNTRRAIGIGEHIEAFGADVFIPHLSLLWNLVSPAPYDRWCERDNAVLDRCDALYRMSGESPGADAEVRRAHEHRMAVFHAGSEDAIVAFIERWSVMEPLRQGVSR